MIISSKLVKASCVTQLCPLCYKLESKWSLFWLTVTPARSVITQNFLHNTHKLNKVVSLITHASSTTSKRESLLYISTFLWDLGHNELFGNLMILGLKLQHEVAPPNIKSLIVTLFMPPLRGFKTKWEWLSTYRRLHLERILVQREVYDPQGLNEQNTEHCKVRATETHQLKSSQSTRSLKLFCTKIAVAAQPAVNI